MGRCEKQAMFLLPSGATVCDISASSSLAQTTVPYGSANNVHFHKLPSEPQRRAAWLRAINRDGPAGLGSERGFVCSDHSLPQDYETNLNVLRSLGFEKKNARLKRDAVPTQNLLLDAPPKKLRRCEAWNKVPRERHDHVGRLPVFLSRYIGDHGHEQATAAALLAPSYAAMLQSAQAWQPQVDPPLPPIRTSRLESWFEEFAAALYHNGIWIQELMYEVLEYHLPHDLKHHLTYFSWSPRPYDRLTPLAPQPVQTIPLPATGHIDSTSAAAPCTVAFAAETWSAELSVPGDSTTSAEPPDLPADSPPVPAPVEARDTTHTMDPEPAVTLHAISFPCTPVPAAQNLVNCQHLLTTSSMYPTEVQAPEHARLNVHNAVTMSGNPEGRTPGSTQVEHTVHAPTDAQLNHPPTTTYACLSISTPSTAHDNCDATSISHHQTSVLARTTGRLIGVRRRVTRRQRSEKAIYQCPLSWLVITVNHVARHRSEAHRFQLICTILGRPGGRRSW
ncbi:hypothetical protein HPB51_026565 [Rhipicephalus microplus]|uniref:THAP-type domain-containing protein n=1 Tax=Rhipicephalus microplus TaxID=6941 RepID=A0A9J6D2P5_RHIMP|nr:hypothetical protein HPB51_026565 [Rhipicephalus microplus]